MYCWPGFLAEDRVFETKKTAVKMLAAAFSVPLVLIRSSVLLESSVDKLEKLIVGSHYLTFKEHFSEEIILKGLFGDVNEFFN